MGWRTVRRPPSATIRFALSAIERAELWEFSIARLRTVDAPSRGLHLAECFAVRMVIM